MAFGFVVVWSRFVLLEGVMELLLNWIGEEEVFGGRFGGGFLFVGCASMSTESKSFLWHRDSFMRAKE